MNPLFNTLQLELKRVMMVGMYGGKVNSTLFNYVIVKGYQNV